MQERRARERCHMEVPDAAVVVKMTETKLAKGFCDHFLTVKSGSKWPRIVDNS